MIILKRNKIESYESYLEKIVKLCGDSDTNVKIIKTSIVKLFLIKACIVGGLAGAIVGLD
jgi:hypothetical protein